MSLDSEFKDAMELVTFFNCNLKKVNYFLMRIAAVLGHRPDWLRGKQTLSQLPRWNDNGSEKTFIDMDKRSQTEICERLIWTIEELNGEWVLDVRGFGFADANEALHFKLRWA